MTLSSYHLIRGAAFGASVALIALTTSANATPISNRLQVQAAPIRTSVTHVDDRNDRRYRHNRGFSHRSHGRHVVDAPFTHIKSGHRVVVEAPFTDVYVRRGHGVRVRAPFVDLWIPH